MLSRLGTSNIFSMLLPNSRTARVVLPTKEEIDTDEEGDDVEHKGSQNPEEAVDVGDPLEDWPDDTEVRFTLLLPQ